MPPAMNAGAIVKQMICRRKPISCHGLAQERMRPRYPITSRVQPALRAKVNAALRRVVVYVRRKPRRHEEKRARKTELAARDGR